MMKTFTKLLFGVVLGMLVFVQPTWGQTESTEPDRPFMRVVMSDGSVRIGELISMDAQTVQIKTQYLGKVDIPKYLIAGMEELDEEEFLRQQKANQDRAIEMNPQATRYFFAPSGFQLENGEGYFQTNVGLNSVSLGLNDNVTIGGLISFVGAGGSFKVGKEIAPNVHISAGGIGFKDYYDELEKPIGLVFINMTWGTEDRNLTLNLGTGSKISQNRKVVNDYIVEMIEYSPGYFDERYVVTDYDVITSSRPLLLNVSAMTQIAQNRWFITENYLIRMVYESETGLLPYTGYFWPGSNSNNLNENITILSMGIRNLSTKSGWLWDYGIVGVIGDGFGFGAPWISATFAF